MKERTTENELIKQTLISRGETDIKRELVGTEI